MIKRIPISALKVGMYITDLNNDWIPHNTLREEDSLARLGGDEFAAIIGNVPDAVTLDILLSRLLTVIAEPVWVANHSVEVSASMGYTLYPQGEEIDGDQLLRQADQAMYRAKRVGKNRYCCFQDADA